MNNVVVRGIRQMQIENKEAYKEIPISVLGLSTKPYHALIQAQYNTLFLLIEHFDELLHIPGMGIESIAEIENVLSCVNAQSIYPAACAESGIAEETHTADVMRPTTLPDEICKRPATDLNVPLRVHNAFLREGISTIEEVLALTPEQMLQMKNMGRLSQQHLLEQIELLYQLGIDYFPPYRKEEPEPEHIELRAMQKAHKRELDVATVVLLQEKYGFKTAWLCDWYGVSRQRVYQKLGKKVNKGNWLRKQLLSTEYTVIADMINSKSFYHEREGCKYYLLNNMLDDCAFLIVSDEDIKCFFLSDLPDALAENTKAARLHQLTQDECGMMDALGNTIEYDMREHSDGCSDVENIFAHNPLLGSKLLPKEYIKALNQNSRQYIERVLHNARERLSLQEEMQITLCIVNYAKYWDTEDERGFWQYITTQFGYHDKGGKLRNLLCNCIRNALVKNQRWFVTSTKRNQFKASIVLHAFSTKRSWLHFCDFLFDFYKTNLNWAYIEGDPMIAQMICALRNKMQDIDDVQDEDIEISSKIYRFREGIIKLILHRPQFSMRLVSHMLKRIDGLINHTAGPVNCYEDQLCDEWMTYKLHSYTKPRQNSVPSEKRTIAINCDQINPIYQLFNSSEIQISFPDVRLAQNDFESLQLTIYHDEQIVEQKNLRYYGNELGKSMAGFSLNLEDYLSASGLKSFNLRLVITCDSTEIYNSRSVLFRKCIAFHNKAEIDIANCHPGEYSVFYPSGNNSNITCINAEKSLIKKNAYIEGWYLTLQKGFAISLGEELLALDNDQSEGLRVILNVESTVYYIENGTHYSVVTSQETIQVLSFDPQDMKKYGLIINDKRIGLDTLPCEESNCARIYQLKLGAFETDEISIQVVDFKSNRLILQRLYKIIPAFSYCFSKPFYFSAEDYMDARLKLVLGGEVEKEYPFAQGDSSISIPYDEGKLEISIPVLCVIDNADIAWNGTNRYWIGDIPQERFLYVHMPDNETAALLLNAQPVGTEKQNVFALGNACYGYNRASEDSWLDVVLTVSKDGMEPRKYTIGRIAVQEQFNEKPVFTMDGNTLMWNRGYGFIGDATARFILTICEGTAQEKTYDLNINEAIVAEDLQLPLGEYRYTIRKESGNLFAQRLQDIDSGSFFVGDINEIRFLGSVIRIDTITFEDDSKYAAVKIRPSYIDNIEYIGIQYVNSEERECPVYSGTMFFIGNKGNRHEYSFRDRKDPNGCQLYQINPVRIIFINDSTLSITNAHEDGLYYYRYYDRQAMENVYQMTDREPPESHQNRSRSKYDLADLYLYTKEGDSYDV